MPPERNDRAVGPLTGNRPVRWRQWVLTMMLFAGLYAACDGGGGGSTTGPTGSGSDSGGSATGGPTPTTGEGGAGGGSGGGTGGSGGHSLSLTHFRAVEVVVIPSGAGTVSDDFAASGSVVQDCTDCTERYRVGTRVRLSAEPTPGFSFEQWQGGGCDASPLPTCSLTVETDTRITAIFR